MFELPVRVVQVIITCGGSSEVQHLMKFKVVAIVILLSTVILPISDMVTDWAFTISYVTADEQYKRDFGGASAVLLCSANLITAVVVFAWDYRNPENARFHPFVGTLLSLTGFRVSVMAALDAYRICKEGAAEVSLSPEHESSLTHLCTPSHPTGVGRRATAQRAGAGQGIVKRAHCAHIF